MNSLKVAFTPQFARNPYQRQLADDLGFLDCELTGTDFDNDFMFSVISNKPDIFHIHWLSFFFIKSNKIKSFLALVWFFLKLIILKLRGIKIVWTVHNLKDHENPYPRLDQMCNWVVAQLADGILTHCNVAKNAVVDNLGLEKSKNKVFVIPHGHYLNSYENTIDRLAARKALKIDEDKLVMLFLGKIRPYKGVFELIELFKKISMPKTQLIIAGKPVDEVMKNDIQQQIIGEDNIKFISDFIPDDEIQVYMNACDVVMFPYRNILTSGAIVLAMSFGKACLAPRLGCIDELLDQSGSFLYDASQPTGLLEAMEKILEQKNNLQLMGEHNLKLAQELKWSGIAKQTFDVYQQCLKTAQ